jgi:hypothetical protein
MLCDGLASLLHHWNDGLRFAAGTHIAPNAPHWQTKEVTLRSTIKPPWVQVLCDSLAGGFLLSIHSPEELGWMDTGEAETGRGFPGLQELIATRLSMPSAPALDAVQSVCHR